VTATNFALNDGKPTWKIRVDSADEFRQVEHSNDFRIFYYPGGAVLSWVLKLTTPSFETLSVHHAFDLSDQATRDYLGAVASSGKVLLRFEGSEDRETAVSVGSAKLSRLLKQGTEYNERLSTIEGADAIRRFLGTFDPIFRDRGAEAAWAEVDLTAGVAERPQPVEASAKKVGATSDLRSQSQTVRGTDRRRKPVPREDSSGGGESDGLPFEPLLKSARADLFRTNAFRIAELPVDVSSRDLDKRQRLVEMAAQTGAAVPPGSHRALPIEGSVSADLLRDSITRLRDPGLRIIDEFFWFWPMPGAAPGRPDEALVALREGNFQAAVDLWSSRTGGIEAAALGTHNLAVLYHAMALDAEAAGKEKTAQGLDVRFSWEKAFQNWNSALQADLLWDRLRERIRELNDPRLPSSAAGRIRRTLPKALVSMSAQLAAAAAQAGRVADAERHSRILSKCGFESATVEEALREACAPLRDRILVLSSAAQKEYEEAPEKGLNIADRLLSQGAALLSGMDALFPAGHMVRSDAHDDVAVQALIASVRYYNLKEGQEAQTLKVLARVLPLAESQAAREKIQGNIDTILKNQSWEEENRHFLKCWFCTSRKPHKGAEASVDMHANVQRQRVAYNTTRTTWDKRTLVVPRCAFCQAAHKKVESWGNIGAAIGFLCPAVYFVSLIVKTPKEAAGIGCGGLIASAIAAGVLALISKGIGGLFRPSGVKSDSYKEKFPTVLDARKKGWALGAKP